MKPGGARVDRRKRLSHFAAEGCSGRWGRRFRLPTVSLKTSDTAGPLVIPASSIVHLDAVIWNEWISHAAASHNGSAAAVFHCAHGLFRLAAALAGAGSPARAVAARVRCFGLGGYHHPGPLPGRHRSPGSRIAPHPGAAARNGQERKPEAGQRRRAERPGRHHRARHAPRARHGGNAATGECAARGHPGQYGGRPGRGGPAAAHHLRQPGVRRNDGRRRAARARHSIGAGGARPRVARNVRRRICRGPAAAAAADPFRQHTVL